jgi:N12 class adenine-specific DNA methylase
MMLGTMAFDSSMYGNNSETTLNPDGRNLRKALLSAIEFLPENTVNELPDLDDFTADTIKIPADPMIKNYCYTVMDDGNIYQRVDSHMEQRDFAKTATERVKAMIDMRVLTRNILTQQLDGCTADELKLLQNQLNEKYDKFYKKFGAINARYNISLFGDDSDFPLL